MPTWTTVGHNLPIKMSCEANVAKVQAWLGHVKHTKDMDSIRRKSRYYYT
ncbi:hypothetical protein DENIT_20523 [Pseudomonas veronii]|nr:hypothetical protein DENIT_20523 [Pseudomonas veronii]